MKEPILRKIRNSSTTLFSNGTEGSSIKFSVISGVAVIVAVGVTVLVAVGNGVSVGGSGIPVGMGIGAGWQPIKAIARVSRMMGRNVFLIIVSTFLALRRFGTFARLMLILHGLTSTVTSTRSITFPKLG